MNQVIFMASLPPEICPQKSQMEKSESKMFRAASLLPGVSQMVTRCAIAVVMWPHGAQLLLGSFGGYGFNATMEYLTQNMGLPWLLSLAVILSQFFGSLFILAGLWTRANALLLSVIVIGMIFSGHTEHGFFMNWFGNQKGEGFEYHILLLGLCLSLLLTSSYRWSLDQVVLKTRRSTRWEL